MNDWLSAFFPAGFYYKTFMWPRKAWKALYEPIIRRAAGWARAHARPIPIAMRSAMRTATCWSWAADRRVSRPRSPPPTSARASCCAMRPPSSAAACSADHRRAHRRRGRRSTGCGSTVAALAQTRAGHLARLAPPRSATFRTISSALNQRLTDHLAVAARAPAARAAVAGARAAGGARDRRHRAAPGISGQRPAGHPAGRRRADLSEPLRGARRQSRGRRDRLRCLVPGGARSARRGRRGRGHRRRALASAGGVLPEAARRAGIETCRCATVLEHRRRTARAGRLARRDRRRRPRARGARSSTATPC